MSSENPSFEDWQLMGAEIFQYYAGPTRWGAKIVDKMAGHESSHYQQLLWLPFFKIKHANISNFVTVRGDPDASGPARKWPKGAVLTVPRAEMSQVKDRLDWDVQEAIAYRSSKAWHVGISAVSSTILTEVAASVGLGEDRVAVAVRRGHGATDFTVGGYDRNTGRFMSVVSGMEATSIDISDLDQISSKIILG